MLIRIFVCLLCAVALAGAQQTNPKPAPGTVCPGDCTSGREKVKDVFFDPDGGFTGRKLFARQDCVRVSIRGASPGMHFKVVVNETVVDETALQTTSALSGISIPSPGNDKSTPATQPQSALDQHLSGESAFIMPLSTGVAEAETKGLQLHTLSTSLDAVFGKLRTYFSALQSASGLASAKQNASNVITELDAVSGIEVDSQTGALNTGTPKSGAAVAQNLREADKNLQSKPLSKALSEIASSNALPAEKKDMFGFAAAHLDAHDAQLAADSQHIEQYAAFLDSLDAIKQRVRSIEDAPSSTVLATIFGDWHEARTITLALQNATVDPETSQLGDFQPVGSSITIVMGQPVFAISGGFAVSPLARISYQTLGTSAGSAGSSSGSTGTIGYQEHSSTRVQPMAFISGSLWDGTTSWMHGSVHMMAGLTISNNQISTNPEFLFGPALSFLRERLFFTAGAYGGFQQVLQGGYTVGGAAPSGSIPTLNQFHWRPGFAISWRIISASKSNTSDPAPAANPNTKPASKGNTKAPGNGNNNNGSGGQ